MKFSKKLLSAVLSVLLGIGCAANYFASTTIDGNVDTVENTHVSSDIGTSSREAYMRFKSNAVYSVNITWGELKFKTEVSWNPSTCSFDLIDKDTNINSDDYGCTLWQPVTADTGDKITITNNSNVPVEAFVPAGIATIKPYNGYFCTWVSPILKNEKGETINEAIEDQTDGDTGDLTITLNPKTEGVTNSDVYERTVQVFLETDNSFDDQIISDFCTDGVVQIGNATVTISAVS